MPDRLPSCTIAHEVPRKVETGKQSVALRALRGGDSLGELTAMLHRAFSRLRRKGLNCTCIDQSVAVTRERIEKGACYVAVCDRRLVGTITLYDTDLESESAWYHRRAVASIHQLGVDPEFQGRGLGTQLLRFAEGRARARGYQELALETPEPAKNLVAFYAGHGYRPVESVRFRGKHYRSVVLSKRLAEENITNVLVRRPVSHIARRHPSAIRTPSAAHSGSSTHI